MKHTTKGEQHTMSKIGKSRCDEIDAWCRDAEQEQISVPARCVSGQVCEQLIDLIGDERGEVAAEFAIVR